MNRNKDKEDIAEKIRSQTEKMNVLSEAIMARQALLLKMVNCAVKKNGQV